MLEFRSANPFFLQLRKAAAKSDFKHIFGITAVNLAARLFRYDPESEKLVQLVDRELQIFAEGDRELVETFVLGVKDTLHKVQKLAESSVPADKDDLARYLRIQEMVGIDGVTCFKDDPKQNNDEVD